MASQDSLLRQDQETIALWLAKTMMVFDRSYPNSLVPQEHLNHLRTNSEPPPGSVAWLSAYGGTKYVASNVSSPSPYRPADDDHGPGWAVTMLVGELIMQMVNRAEAEAELARFMRETGEMNVQVWPAVEDSRAWPPKHVKGDEMLEAVSFPTGEAPS